MNRSHTIGVWTRIGHGEDAWVGEPEFGMDLVFTVKTNGEQWRDKGQREDVQFPSVYTRPTSTRPRRIASVNHRILQNECVCQNTTCTTGPLQTRAYSNYSIKYHTVVVPFFGELCKVLHACGMRQEVGLGVE